MSFSAIFDRESALLYAFEERVRHDPAADIADFLPAADHPRWLPVLTELIRLDMEYAWGRGKPRIPVHYFDLFPALRENASAIAEIAFEDYRIRKLGVEPATPDEYAERYAISTADWPIDPTMDEEPEDDFLGPSHQTPLPVKASDPLRTSVVRVPVISQSVVLPEI